jgi:hypothetical protein
MDILVRVNRRRISDTLGRWLNCIGKQAFIHTSTIGTETELRTAIGNSKGFMILEISCGLSAYLTMSRSLEKAFLPVNISNAIQPNA